MEPMTTPEPGEPTAARSPRGPLVASVPSCGGPGTARGPAAVSAAPAVLRTGVRRPGQPVRVGSTLQGTGVAAVSPTAVATTDHPTQPSTGDASVRTRLFAFGKPADRDVRPAGHRYGDGPATSWGRSADLRLDDDQIDTTDQINPQSRLRGSGGRTV